MARRETDREATARRLLTASPDRSYDPELDIDWDAPLVDGAFFAPPAYSSLYGTEIWARMSHRQRVELTRCEVANMLGFGIWVETMFIQMLVRHALTFDPVSEHLRYALTEVGDETRHSTMFSRTLVKLDRGPYRPHLVDRVMTDLLRAFSTKPLAFVAVLFVEEIFDAIQRGAMKDDSIQPLVRQVNRIHVIEEARHMRYAREELLRMVPRLPRAYREGLALAVAIGLGVVERSWRVPAMYAEAGLDANEAARAAKTNPHWRATLDDCMSRFRPFYAELGLLTPAAKKLWHRYGYTV
ncbi:AurF N-oxygenase family protein [Amycolatopsis nigrescens]|uniref:AurF N-oxygenase family protein n=1 Tax=Amycolatopsis nigrescens TaxID=381445 RepID=UPI00036B8E39|nr:diiron oxygenase [Amycolatopsis nigrescens]